jgi:galactoside O-acetyltransferase
VRLGKSCWLSYGVFGEATGGEIVLGDYVVVAHRALLLTSSGLGHQSTVMSLLYPTEVGSISLGDHCWIGAACTLLPGVHLEEGTVAGANSLLVRGGYGPWSVYGGTPSKLLKQLDHEAWQAAKAKAGLVN